MYMVGGAVRDSFMGIKSRDVDFAVEAESYDAMKQGLVDQGFRIWLENPEFFTIRAHVPTGHWASLSAKDGDFVLCRKDGVYTDGRRPDTVEVGTIYDDLARRDFTMNAIAITENGGVIDPHHGKKDIQDGIVRFVGKPEERIAEDGLRVLRAIRFVVTKDFILHPNTRDALKSTEAAQSLSRVSQERIKDELDKMLAHDTQWTLQLLVYKFPDLLPVIFTRNMHLVTSLKEVV